MLEDNFDVGVLIAKSSWKEGVENSLFSNKTAYKKEKLSGYTKKEH